MKYQSEELSHSQMSQGNWNSSEANHANSTTYSKCGDNVNKSYSYDINKEASLLGSGSSQVYSYQNS